MSLIIYFPLTFDLPKCNTSHLLRLNSVCHLSVLFCSWSIFYCIPWQPSSQTVAPAILVSSVNLQTNPSMFTFKSFYTSSQTAEVPEHISKEFHWSQTSSVSIIFPPQLSLLPVSQFWIHMIKSMLIVCILIFWISLPRGILSTAWLKSVDNIHCPNIIDHPCHFFKKTRSS